MTLVVQVVVVPVDEEIVYELQEPFTGKMYGLLQALPVCP
jgi:hypothetical protein